MKLLVATDFHGAIAPIEKLTEKASEEKPNLIAICGDITNFGSYSLAERLLHSISVVKVPVLFVPGNCDPPELVKGVNLNDVTCLHGICKTQNDYCFIGVGGSNLTPFHTPLEFSEEELLEKLENASTCINRSKKVILITHVPPHNTQFDVVRLRGHVGSESIRKFIESKNPILALCGHIHEARGIDTLGLTTIINPGPATRGCYATVLLDGEVKVQLNSLW